jgi:hypothetical protein
VGTTCSCGDGHETYGACLRAKNLRIGYCKSHVGIDYTRQKQWDQELSLYRDARDQGVQPAGTQTHQTRLALDVSDKSGKAFDASNMTSLVQDAGGE